MLTAILSAALAAAAPTTISCPMTLPRETVTVHAPQGWTGYSPSLMRLTGFGMMAGAPESMTYLVPTSSKPGATTWRFGRREEKWLYCTYDGSGAIQISRRLDDAATECTLTYRETKSDGITGMVATCR
jgi:hypothetical protein